jgi:hypothetical protein
VERAAKESIGQVRYYVSDSLEGGDELVPPMTEEEWLETHNPPATHTHDHLQSPYRGE